MDFSDSKSGNSVRWDRRNTEKESVDHLVFAGILFALFGILLAYAVVFVHMPSRKFMNRDNEECAIQRARLSCWRRKLFSSAHIEEGRHICWRFVVKYSNVTTLAQYMVVDDFPIERDGCGTEESCGMEQWPCRVSDDPYVVSLRWQYPVRNMTYASVGMLCTLLFGTSALVDYFRSRQQPEEEIGTSKFSIPFFTS